MPNNFGNSNSTYFSIVKTTKPVNEITNYVSDRLIINVKEGRMYFDYSDSERIEISNKAELYRYNGEFNSIRDEPITVSYSELYDYDGVTLNTEGKQVIRFTLVFDKHGNMGVITEIDQINARCKILVLTNAVTLDMISDWGIINRVEY